MKSLLHKHRKDEVGHLGPSPTDWGLPLSLAIVQTLGAEQAPCKCVEGLGPPCQVFLHNAYKNGFIKIRDVLDFSYFYSISSIVSYT